MFFKDYKNKNKNTDLSKIAALLIHAAKIDENYSEKEENRLFNKLSLKIGR